MNKRPIAAGVLIVAVGVGGWFGYDALTRQDMAVPTRAPVAIEIPDAPAGPDAVETVDTGVQAAVDSGSTPMAQRVAVVGLLNKRNGVARDVTLKPGQATRLGDVVIKLRACEQTAPWEQEQLTGAFVQVYVKAADRKWRSAFSGWLYKERPGLNVVQHPVYDVWTKSCTMAFPDKGPDTVSVGDGAAAPAARRSSARKSPEGAAATPADAGAASVPASAADSNAT